MQLMFKNGETHKSICHPNCSVGDDKASCWAMNDEGYCRICPCKGHYSKHFNSQIFYEMEEY